MYRTSYKKAGIVMKREEKLTNFNSCRTAKNYEKKNTFQRRMKFCIKIHTHTLN